VLPKRSEIAKVKHHAALPFAELPEFMQALRELPDVGARALEFTILTAARVGEVRGATWDEINGDVWTIPAERTKAGREHRVPLSPRALAIVDELRRLRVSQFIFPGRKGCLCHATFRAVLHRAERPDLTTHGFRSTFRDWAAECTNFPRELAELALAHRVGDDTERAYQRGDLLERRRKLMAAWASYCSEPRGTVIALKTG
jgi:integrase